MQHKQFSFFTHRLAETFYSFRVECLQCANVLFGQRHIAQPATQSAFTYSQDFFYFGITLALLPEGSCCCSFFDTRHNRTAEYAVQIISSVCTLTDDFGDCGGDAFVEHVGDDACRCRLRDEACNRFCRSEFMLGGYLPHPVIECPAENPREGERVVYLIREIAPPCAYHACTTLPRLVG